MTAALLGTLLGLVVFVPASCGLLGFAAMERGAAVIGEDVDVLAARIASALLDGGGYSRTVRADYEAVRAQLFHVEGREGFRMQGVVLAEPRVQVCESFARLGLPPACEASSCLGFAALPGGLDCASQRKAASLPLAWGAPLPQGMRVGAMQRIVEADGFELKVTVWAWVGL